VVAYIFLAFMPLFLIGLFAWTLYRFHKKKVAAESHRS
jgi:cbb3-type cytochrome oxidase subunit 3